MRFSLNLPIGLAGDMTWGAQLLEEHGVDAGFVTDHPAPDARWLNAGGHHAYEPTVALAFAASTERLLLHTHIYVAAYRNPFLAATALGSLHQLSAGRLIVGLAAGYLRPEFAALGVEFDRRNELTDEAVGLMRRVWAGETIETTTDRFRSRFAIAAPPGDSGHGPPIWIGGNSVSAIRRAARSGDGWSPFPTPPGLAESARTASMATLDDLLQRLGRLRSECESVGREELPEVCCGPFSLSRYVDGGIGAAELVDELGAMSAMGVTWAAVGLPATSVEEFTDGVGRFATEVIDVLR